MNGTLQSQKYKNHNSFISILQLNAEKETVKTIKHECTFQNYTIYGKEDASWKNNVFFKNYDAKCLGEYSLYTLN